MTKTVLTVDDSASVRQALGMALRGAGYEVLEARDGREALALLQRLHGRRLHLIVSDLNMPELDGLGLLRAVRTLPAHRFTPLVLLTTESSPAKKAQARAAGATAWMLKPFTPHRLLALVHSLVRP